MAPGHDRQKLLHPELFPGARYLASTNPMYESLG